MANSLGTLTSALVVQTALDLVFNMFPLLSEITLDLSDKEVDFGASIKSRIYSVPAVSDFGATVADKTDTDVSVTLSAHKQIRHAFTPAEYSGTKRNLVVEAARPIAVAIGSHMVAQIAALWTNTNYGGAAVQETVTTSANMNWSALTGFRQTLNGRGVPMISPRFAVLLSAGYKALLNDTTIIANPQRVGGFGDDVVGTGLIKGVGGFKSIIEYPDLPTTGTSSGTKTGVFGTPDTTVLANRVQKDPRDILNNAPFPGNYNVVKNAETGLSVLVTEWIDPADMKAHVRVSWMYGVAVGNANNLQISKSA